VTWITFVTLLASSTALCVSIGACIATVRLSRRCRSTSAERLSAQLTELAQVQEAHGRDLSLIRQRLNQQAHRNRKLGRPDSSVAWEPSEDPSSTATNGEDKAAIRAELNRRIAAGEFRRP
jgi:hypothetical protein